MTSVKFTVKSSVTTEVQTWLEDIYFISTKIDCNEAIYRVYNKYTDLNWEVSKETFQRFNILINANNNIANMEIVEENNDVDIETN